MRQTATGALAAGLLGGISEPSLYGIHLRFKRIYPRMLVGCFAGGLTIAILGTPFQGVKTQAFAFTSLLTIPVFDPMWVYAIAIAVAFTVSMVLIVITDYRTPEQRAEARGELPAQVPDLTVGAAEQDKAKQWLDALGGTTNVVKVEPVAETRVRVEVADSSSVDTAALQEAGLAGVVQVGPTTWHLVAGFDSTDYALAMSRDLVTASA